jgi:hypothetical protein
VQRHHLLTRDRDGRVVQDVSFFELKPPPESDPQTAGERVPYGLSLVFWAWKRSLGGLGVLVSKAGKGLRMGRAGVLDGDDEWGRRNKDRQLALLALG